MEDDKPRTPAYRLIGGFDFATLIVQCTTKILSPSVDLDFARA